MNRSDLLQEIENLIDEDLEPALFIDLNDSKRAEFYKTVLKLVTLYKQLKIQGL